MTSGFARTALALSLALASGAACALGLGQIEVKSRAGQPLLAEIPVISSDRDELAQLRAGLASPETFQRIGLQPPQGIVTDLRFTLALDAAGKPVIRVTSSQPVTQPLLTFLIEVDWGQGRLTREYSALIDTPRTAAAPMQPPIKAPTGAASNTIERPLEAPLPFGAQPQQSDPLAVENQLGSQDPNLIGAAPPSPLPAEPEPIAMQPEPAPMPAPPRANAGTIERPAPRPAAPAVDAEGGIVVARGQTLSSIAAGLAGGHSLDQTMIALLRANPEAFIGGNVNRLRQGAVLRLPADGVAAIDPREASELVRAQVQQWRQARQPVPQPIGLEADRTAQAPVAPAAQNAARGSDARLEIVPPGASRATQAGTQSGLSAGGEGNMMRQEIQQANETLAAREAELAELKSRVAELEKLQNDQQKLIALKDSELTATQQRLAEQQARADGGSPLPWLFGGLGVLALLVGGWVLSRREPKRPNFRAPQADPSASSRPSPVPATAAADATAGEALRRRPEPAAEVIDPVAQLLGEAPAERRGEPQRAEPAPAPAAEAPVAAEPTPAAQPFWTSPRQEPQSAPQQRVPTWHAAEAGSARNAAPLRSEPKLERTASSADPVVPAVAAAPAAPVADAASGQAAPGQAAPGQERIELARAYLDLGDEGSARQLLGEVLINGDHAARQQAARMLRELEASSG